MKKKIVLLLFVALLSLYSYAQRSLARWQIQPKIGLNIATLTNDDDAKIRPAFVGGVELDYLSGQNLVFSFGTLYSQQGCKSNNNGYDTTIKMDYINVPLMINYYVTDGLALKAGIQPSFLIYDKVKVSANGVSAEVGIEESLRAAGFDAKLKEIDLSIPIGISYVFSNIQLDARFNLGITKTFSGNGINSIKNSVFQFTLGYKFGL